jgi:hypothetical protein
MNVHKFLLIFNNLTLCSLLLHYLEVLDNEPTRPKHVADCMNAVRSVSITTVYFVGLRFVHMNKKQPGNMQRYKIRLWVISGFWCSVNEILSVLGFCAV